MTLRDTAWAWEQKVPAREKLLLLAMSEVFGDLSEWREWTEEAEAALSRLSGLSDLEIGCSLACIYNEDLVEVRRGPNGEQLLRFAGSEDRRPSAAALATRRDDPGYVYVLRCGDYFKIGKSKDPNARIKAIQTGTPHRVQQLARIEVRDMGSLERALHERFASRRVQGEWFAFDQSEVGLIMDALREASEADAGFWTVGP